VVADVKNEEVIRDLIQGLPSKHISPAPGSAHRLLNKQMALGIWKTNW
jgi:hypothetical protein